VERIPEPVRRFVGECIESVGLLEVLLLLQSDPDRAWTPAAVSREIRSERGWAELQLEYLRTHGLLEAERGTGERAYRYSPSRPELDAVVGQLREAFETRRVAVIRLIFRQPQVERLRAFSEAFRFRRER
jgi:hypothetical protein